MHKSTKSLLKWILSIAGLVIAGLIVHWLKDLQLLTGLRAALKYVKLFLLIRVEVALWHILLVILLAFVIIVAFLLFRHLRNKKVYKIEGLYWEISESTSTGQLYPELIPICPKCRQELHEPPDPRGCNLAAQYLPCKLRCKSCGFEKKLELSFISMEEKINKEIERRCRIRWHPLQRLRFFATKAIHSKKS